MVSEVPYGHCGCGCGERTDIATENYRRLGWVKGEPKRFSVNPRCVNPGHLEPLTVADHRTLHSKAA